MKDEDIKDILDAIKTINEIDKQIQNPDRQGMIDVLKEAKKKALFEITLIESPLPKSSFKPFEECDPVALYNNLPLYKKGLVDYCINKFGEEMYNKYYNEKQ